MRDRVSNTGPKAAVRRLALARAISTTGSTAAFTALMVFEYRATGSAMWLTFTLLATWGASGFISPFTAMLGDRFDRRRVMIASDLGGAVSFGAMALLHRPGALLVAAFLAVAVESPFWSASGAAIPNVAGEEHLGWANGLVAMGRYLGVTVGPALGGLLVGVIGASWVFAANAFSFAVSALLVKSVRARFSGDRSAHEVEEHRGALAGLSFLLRDRVLRTISLAWIVFVLGIGMAVVADLPLANSFHAGTFGFGMLAATWGGGSILGSFAGRWLKERNEIAALVLANGAVALAAGGIALSPWFTLVLASSFAFGVFDGVTIVADQSIRQRRTPDAVRSRVLAASEGAVNIFMALSFLAGGFLVPALGPQGAYGVGAVSAGLATFVLVPLLRRSRAPVDTVSAGPSAGEAPPFIDPKKELPKS
jgi:MFS family permease